MGNDIEKRNIFFKLEFWTKFVQNFGERNIKNFSKYEFFLFQDIHHFLCQEVVIREIFYCFSQKLKTLRRLLKTRKIFDFLPKTSENVEQKLKNAKKFAEEFRQMRNFRFKKCGFWLASRMHLIFSKKTGTDDF